MRDLENLQEDSVKLDGEKAQALKVALKVADKEASEICQELHRAVELAESKFESLRNRLKPRLKTIMKGTDLEDVDVASVNFDLKHLEKHGVAFATVAKSDPVLAFLEMLKRSVTDGPSPFSDDMLIVEPVSPTRH
jgi:hypothetical protein